MQLSKLTSNKDNLSTIDVNDQVFDCRFNETLVHQILNAYFYNSHTGTKAQKTRSDVSGGGRKPWRQKGMGRARTGSSRNPIWRAGGVTFAAKPMQTKQKVSKKMFRGALICMLSQLVREKRLFAIDTITLEQPKTKKMVQWIKETKLDGRILFLVRELHTPFMLSIRNIPTVEAFDVGHINLLQLVSYDYILVEESAITILQERLG